MSTTKDVHTVREVQTVYVLVFLGVALISSLWLLSSGVVGLPGEADPLPQVIAVTALLALLSFFAGFLTSDYSWTDRLWSTAPIGLAWIYAIAAPWDIRLVVAASLVSLWGLRLTVNFARRGGYSGKEDYRWPILEKRIGNPILWQLFNFFFIAVFQHFLFVCFTIPLYVLYLNAGAKPGVGFWLASAAVLGFLVLETVADQQQWDFQRRKAAARGVKVPQHSDPDIDHGFRTSGLFRWSRHPNYLGELGVWWSMFLAGAASAGTLLHWSAAGPVLLTFLFVGSTYFTEGITRSKYPHYDDYRKYTWPIFPKPGAGYRAEID